MSPAFPAVLLVEITACLVGVLLMRYTFAVGRRSRGSLAHWLAGCATLVAVAVALIAAVAAFYVLMIG